MSDVARATVLLTGSELTRGAIQDANGRFLASELTRLGVPARSIVMIGDHPTDLMGALEAGLQDDILVVSGGLGPTHDDRTVELLAQAAKLELRLDEDLHRQIERTSRDAAERLGRPYHDFEPGVRKQATVPTSAESLGLAGTAPGLILRVGRSAVVVLPGPPGELRRLWPLAVDHPWLLEVLSRNPERDRRVLRFYGASESAVARALDAAGGETEGLEVGICARNFEIHVDIAAAPEHAAAADQLDASLSATLEQHLFARDHVPVEQRIIEECVRQGLTLVTAESCTGGGIGSRLTDVAGASQAFRGGVIAYDNDLKRRALAVPDEILTTHGAVSAEVAEAMAEGARNALSANVGVAVTGVAGPGGGTPDKPVGLVHLHVATPSRSEGRRLEIPGDRGMVRARATAAALHLLRLALTQS